MRVSKDDLTWATSEGLISPGQADALWQALTVVGLAIMYAGIQYHRHQARIEEAIRSRIPEGIRQVLPDARARA